jgi:hypothetical protein
MSDLLDILDPLSAASQIVEQHNVLRNINGLSHNSYSAFSVPA